MQRVRIGLTGLACVFLLVLLAAAFFGLTNDERQNGPLAPAAPNTPTENSSVAVESPREPLAELGVAPGYAGDVAGNASGPAAVTPAPAASAPAASVQPTRPGPTPPSIPR